MECQPPAKRNSCQVHMHVKAAVYEHLSAIEYCSLVTPCPSICQSFSQPGTTHRCMAAGVLAFCCDNAPQC